MGIWSLLERDWLAWDGLLWVIDTPFLSFYFTFRRDTRANSSTAKVLLFSLRRLGGLAWMYCALHLKSSFRSISELGFTSKRNIGMGLAGLIQNGHGMGGRQSEH
jgi:hypothetical protein